MENDKTNDRQPRASMYRKIASIKEKKPTCKLCSDLSLGMQAPCYSIGL